jgi:putative CocE/NonD family hydrolase
LFSARLRPRRIDDARDRQEVHLGRREDDMNRIRLKHTTLRRAFAAIVAFAPAALAQRGGPATVPSQGNVAIPTRDGTQLGADVYLPQGTGPFPVLLTITPYGKTGSGRGAAAQLERGYAVVAVDSRGLRASKGKWEPYVHEAQDGFDVQTWVAKQPWCNRKIGMFGTSYPAYTQVAPARYRNPNVKALIPVSAQSDNFGSVWSSDGLLHLAFSPVWAMQQEAIATNQPAAVVDWMKVIWTLPLKNIPEMTGVRSQFLADVIAHDTHDAFWKAMSITDTYSEMDVPALHVTGWYDDLSAETQANFVGMSTKSRSEHARRWQRLLIGPWGHGVPRIADSGFVFGDVDFGKDVKIDFAAMSMKWFDYHLKGVDNGLDKDAPVKIFVMGANKWRDEQEWPLKRARPTRYYLHSKGLANTRFGDGVLSTDVPANEPPDNFRYDPGNPVPTYGGHGCCDYSFAAMGPLDQRVNQQRPDVLVYSTTPLTEDTEVSGIVEAQLTFATDVTDTDFFVTLSDVYPDGKAIDITEGQARARFRESRERPTLLTPNKETSLTVKLWGTSNLFKKGHRIRVHITSSNFPRYNRNLNSGKALGEETERDIHIANTTVFHSAGRASAIVLPIVPNTAINP